jgi:hypothetical protein
VLPGLTEGTILHEAMHNLTGLYDFVPTETRQFYDYQAPFDLRSLLGLETTPGVDPTAGSTIDITTSLVQNQCATNN